MDATVDAEWNALFDFPSDSASFDFTGLNGPQDSDGIDSPPICLSGQSTPGGGQLHPLQLGDSLETLLDNTASGEVTTNAAIMSKCVGRFSIEVFWMLINWLIFQMSRTYPNI